MEMAVAANLASYAHDPNMIKALQERLPQLARRDISEVLSHCGAARGAYPGCRTRHALFRALQERQLQ